MSELQAPTILSPLTQSVLLSSDQNRPLKLSKPRPKQLTCTPSFIDFGDCLPGQIVETEVSVNVEPWQNDILVLHARCDCMNDELNDLPEYIFALARNYTESFSNEIRMKSNSESEVKFTVAMKVPEYHGLLVGLIVVRMLGETTTEPLKIILKSNISLPQVICLRELHSEDSRIVRIMIRTARATKKEDRKIGFKNPSSKLLCVDTQILGLEESIDFVDCYPKTLSIPPGGYFNLMVQMRPSDRFLDYIKRLKKNYTVRRVMLLKVKASSAIFHFPLQIVFVHSDSKQSAE